VTIEKKVLYRAQTNDSGSSELDDGHNDPGTGRPLHPNGVQTGGVLSVKLIRLNFKGEFVWDSTRIMDRFCTTSIL
jgi:hypothetical protein